MNNVTLTEFWEMLNNHDWYYMMSDDIRVERSGQSNWHRLLNIATKGGDPYGELMEAFRSHYFTGKPFNTEQTPKPERPDNGTA